MKTKLILLLSIFFVVNVVNAQEVFNYSQINTFDDDYAATFRSTCSGVEVWLTNTRNGNSKSRKIVVANVNKNGFSPLVELPYPVNQKQDRGKEDLYLDGSPCFNACDPNYGVFVSNRLVNGKTFDNDIYELNQTSPNEWQVKRLDKINSKFWDDSPSLSQDGRFLYFASTRNRYGLGVSDIFVSQKLDNGEWSNPDKLDLKGYNLATPLAAHDGFLYYSVDMEGNNDLDIWRVKLNQITGKPIEGSEQAIPFEGVNKVGTSQADPSFSPGTSWFMFSSDESANKKRDLFYTKIKNVFDTLIVKTSLRTYEYDTLAAEFIDVIKPYSENVIASDLFTGLTANSKSNNGFAQIILPSSIGSSPSEDRRIREVLIKSNVNSIKNISANDTLIYEVGNHCTLEHNLTIWDVNVLESEDCKQNFPITKVEFFVTSYWCPTTKKYSYLTPCQTVFGDPGCVDIMTPPQPCENNDIYQYKVHPATVERIAQPGLCLPYNEVNKFAKEWSENVDKAIDTFVEKMGSALQKPCILRSIREKEKVTIEVTGWTDPRAIDNSCLYTGNEIDFNNTSIKLMNLKDKGSYMPNGILRKGTQFIKSPNNGNQLLSDVRAYYTAVLLDSLWKMSIPKYNELRNSGLIEVVAIGKSVNPDQLALAKQRSVNVVVRTNLKTKLTAQNSPELGRSIALCANGCLENLMCRSLEKTSNFDLKQEIVKAEEKTEELISTQTINPSLSKVDNNKTLNGKYTLQFVSYPEEDKAKEIAGKLASTGITDIRLVTYTNVLGTVYYKVQVGNYLSTEEALKFRKQFDSNRKLIGLSKMPDIIEIK